jgi:bifunctional DNA-binding transcriptional regulator/antitoxin component of YhaV-PrlF toxin-antitoxin module
MFSLARVKPRCNLFGGGYMPQLERRRIYAAGRSLAVTLPQGWLRYLGIKAGDEVEIVTNGDLVIRPVHPPKVAEGG